MTIKRIKNKKFGRVFTLRFYQFVVIVTYPARAKNDVLIYLGPIHD